MDGGVIGMSPIGLQIYVLKPGVWFHGRRSGEFLSFVLKSLLLHIWTRAWSMNAVWATTPAHPQGNWRYVDTELQQHLHSYGHFYHGFRQTKKTSTILSINEFSAPLSHFATVFGSLCWPNDIMQVFGTYASAPSLKPEAPSTFLYSHSVTLTIITVCDGLAPSASSCLVMILRMAVLSLSLSRVILHKYIT